MSPFLSSCQRGYLVAFLIAVCLITVAFVFLVPTMAPIKTGRAADFWMCATGATIDGEAKIAKAACWNSRAWTSRRGGYSPYLEDGWAIYEQGGLHGGTLYKVGEAEVLAAFPKVEKIIQTAIANSNANLDVHAVGIMPAYTEWKASENPDPLLLPGLAKDHYITYVLAEGKAGLVGYLWHQSMPPTERLYTSRWYGAGVLFEWCFLSGLVLFILWPGLRGLGTRRFVIHLAALPFLFLLPCFLGYASASYFTYIGAAGGVVYPFLLMVCRLPGLPILDSIDQVVAPFIPQILQPLSAEPGSIVSMSGASPCGPFSMLGYGLLLFLIFRFAPRLPRLLHSFRARTLRSSVLSVVK